MKNFIKNLLSFAMLEMFTLIISAFGVMLIFNYIEEPIWWLLPVGIIFICIGFGFAVYFAVIYGKWLEVQYGTYVTINKDIEEETRLNERIDRLESANELLKQQNIDLIKDLQVLKQEKDKLDIEYANLQAKFKVVEKENMKLKEEFDCE